MRKRTLLAASLGKPPQRTIIPLCSGVGTSACTLAPLDFTTYLLEGCRETMKAYHEYLELHSYFAHHAIPRLGRVEFETADQEFRELARRFQRLEPAEHTRLRELKALLFRDRP